MSIRERSRARRVLGVLGGVVGCTLTFSSAAVAAALLHLDTPVARRVAAQQVTSLLASTFEGKITLEKVGHLGLEGAGGITARVQDPHGVDVIRAQNLQAKLSVLGLLKSVLAGEGDIDVALSEVTIDDANVDLDTDAKGNLELVNAFEPKDKSPSKPGGRGVKLQIDHAKVKHAWVHGQLPAAPALDVDAKNVEGSVLVAPKQTKIDVTKLALVTRGMPSGADAHGDLEGHLALPSKTGKDLGAEAHFVGDVGGIPASADALIDGKHVDAVVDVRATAAERVRALVREAPVYEQVSARAEAHGELPNLGAKAHVQIGRGNVDVDGKVAFGDDTVVLADVTAKDVDVHAFAPTAPTSTLGAASKIRLVAKEDGTLVGEFSLTLAPGVIGPNVVPAAHLTGDFAKTKAGPRVRAKGQIAEHGAPTEVSLDLHPQDGTASGPSVVDFDAVTTVPSLDGIARIGPMAKGHAKLHAQGKIRLGDQVLDAKLVAVLEDVTKDKTLALRHGNLEAHVTGALANPFIDATFEGEGLDAAGMRFSKIGARSRGQAKSPEVLARLDSGDNRSPSVQVHASIAAGAVTTIEDIQLAVSKDDVAVVTKVAVVRIAGGDVRVERGVIEGLGEPVSVDARISPGKVTIKAASKDLDLARLAHLVNAERQVKSGHLALDVDLALARTGANGHLTLDLSKGTFDGLDAEAKGHVDATVKDRKLFANVHAQLGDAGFAYVNTSTIELAGAPLDPRSWINASGKAEIDAQVDLGKAYALVPKDLVPISEMRGAVIIAGSVGRDRPAENPEVDLTAQTRGLVLAGKTVPAARVDGTEVVSPPPWRISGIDVGFDAHVDADTGQAQIAARLADEHGALVSLDSKSDLPYSELLAHPALAAERMETVPIRAKVTVPLRRLDSLPTFAGTKGMRGTVDLVLDAEGTVREPKLALVAHATGVKAARSPLTARFDGAVTAHYDGTLGSARVLVGTPRGGQVVDGTAEVHAKMGDLLDPTGTATLPWDASADLKLTSFPVQSIAVVGDAQVKGNLSGEITLTDLHKDARVKADLKVDALQIASAKYKGGSLKASIDDKLATADLRIDQPDGYVAANATVPVSWGARLAPTMDATRRLEAAVKAKQFRIAAAQPFLEGTFDELDGKLDADVKVASGGGQAPKFGGQMKLTEGVMQTPALGEEFQGVRATVEIHEDGSIVVNDVVANGTSGRLEAKGKAKMNGLAFENAQLSVHVPTRRPLPISVQGVEVGEAYGDLAVTAKAVPRGIEMAVDVPKWHATLPDTSKNVVQKLEQSADIHIGVNRGESKELVLLPIDAEDLNPHQPRKDGAMELTVKVHLGDDVEIKKGTGLKVGMDGDVRIEVTDSAHVSGQIRLKSGLLDVQGKRFTIEKGTVTFVGNDPANPQVVVTASWGAPDGTMIYADFVGPLETGKVTLRSEPARPKNEILALIMFGSADGMNGNPNQNKTSDSASQAVSAGGGVATQGVNAAVSDLTGMENAQFRVDTSTNNPRPELEYQISKSIAVGVAYVMGVPPPDQPDFLFAKADWRFRRNWSLQTMFGNFGSTIVDAVWQKRY